MKRFVIVAALAIGLAIPAWGQDFYAGLAAVKRGDYAAALKEWKPLAEQGDARAQANLGNMYSEGRGVPQDDAQAVAWYRRSADQGHAFAQFVLGVIYEEGTVVAQDYVQAHMWFSLAAAQGGFVVLGLEMATVSRDLLAEEMTPEQIAEAQRLAREWQPKAE